MLPLQRPEDGFPRALLPDAPGLLVPHQRIPIVDSGQPKVQPLSVDHGVPDNPCVAERTVRHRNRHPLHGVIHDVVIPHRQYRVGARMPAKQYRQHHVIPIDLCFVRAPKCRRVVGMKHLLEDIHMGQVRSRNRHSA